MGRAKRQVVVFGVGYSSRSYRPKRLYENPKLLEILVCPLSKGRLRYDEQKQELISEQAKLAFPIREGIPIMLVEEARSFDEKHN